MKSLGFFSILVISGYNETVGTIQNVLTYKKKKKRRGILDQMPRLHRRFIKNYAHFSIFCYFGV